MPHFELDPLEELPDPPNGMVNPNVVDIVVETDNDGLTETGVGTGEHDDLLNPGITPLNPPLTPHPLLFPEHPPSILVISSSLIIIESFGNSIFFICFTPF